MVWLNNDVPATNNLMLTSDDLSAIANGPATTPEQLLAKFSSQWMLDNPSGLLVPGNSEPGMSQYSYVPDGAASSVLFYMDPSPGDAVQETPDKPMSLFWRLVSDL